MPAQAGWVKGTVVAHNPHTHTHLLFQVTVYPPPPPPPTFKLVRWHQQSPFHPGQLHQPPPFSPPTLLAPGANLFVEQHNAWRETSIMRDHPSAKTALSNKLSLFFACLCAPLPPPPPHPQEYPSFEILRSLLSPLSLINFLYINEPWIKGHTSLLRQKNNNLKPFSL